MAALLILQAGAWPMGLGDPLHHGRADGVTVDEQVWWSWDAGAHLDAAPVMADDRVIIADRTGKVTALDAANGRVLWSHAMASGVVSTPAIGLGRVFVADLGGALMSLDIADGSVLDSAKVGASRAPITVNEGKVFVADEQGTVHAFTATALDKLWSFSVGDVSEQAPRTNLSMPLQCKAVGHPARPIRTAPSVHAGHVVVASMNHYVYAIDERGNPNGTTDLLWRFQTGDILQSTPIIDPQTMRVVVAGYDEQVRALPLQSGQGAKCHGGTPSLQWTTTLAGTVGATKVHAGPAFDGDRLFVAANNGRLYALDGPVQAWNVFTGAPILAAPVVAGDVVVVGNDLGNVQWRSASNGTLLQSIDAGGPVVGLAVVESTTIVATDDGLVQRIGGTPPPRPDLTITELLLVGAGLSIEVMNQGAAPAANTTLDVRENGTLTASYDVPPLAPSQSTQIFHLLFGDPNATIVVIVDPKNTVLEADSGNNEKRYVHQEPESVAALPVEDGPWLGVPWWGWVLVGFATVAAGGGGFWFWQRSRFSWDTLDGASDDWDDDEEYDEDEGDDEDEPEGDW